MVKHSKKAPKHSGSSRQESKRSASSGSDSSSQDFGTSDEEWVEKPSASSQSVSSVSVTQVSVPPRDDWMTHSFDTLRTTQSKQERLLAERQQRDKERGLHAPGQHERELNPYWRDGGSGLPKERPDTSAAKPAIPAGQAAWLRRALQRAQEQADAEGRTLEAVAAERWGSLERLKAMLAEAEGGPKVAGNFTKPSEKEVTGSHLTHGSFQRPDPARNAAKDGTLQKAKPLPQNVARKMPQEWSRGKDFVCSTTAAKESRPMEESEPEPELLAMSQDELNKLNAQLLKAEMKGNMALVIELKRKIEAAKLGVKQVDEKVDDGPEEILLTKTDYRTGVTMPVRSIGQHATIQPKGSKKLSETQEASVEGYFADDNAYTLKDLVEQEKMTTAEDESMLFANMTAKAKKEKRVDDDFAVDDSFQPKKKKKEEMKSHDNAREKQRAIVEHQKYEQTLAACALCLDSPKAQKHLIVAVGIKTYLAVPSVQSLVDGHCLIIPIPHVSSSTQLDEDVWEEMKIWRKGLVAMFRQQDEPEDCVFMETALQLNRQPHMCVECFPVPQDVGEMAPIYFKKALMECEGEWLQNKRLIDLSEKGDVRRALPRGFPYFSVDFGLQSGFAHVIEKENAFPRYFGKEILGGVLDLDYNLWRKPAVESFEAQAAKAKKFKKLWTPFDWTSKVKETLKV